MTKRLGIIPAGGQAERFNGVYKELLPISQEECGLTRCIAAMLNGEADKIVIATNPRKFKRLQEAVKGIPNVQFYVKDFHGVWEVLADIGDIPAERYFFGMPDTIFPLDVFKDAPNNDVVIGEFHTKKTNRFGVLWDGHILDKRDLPLNGGYPAWGTWNWSSDAMKFLVRSARRYRNHTPAMESTMQRFGSVSVFMPFYFDFACFEDYKEFLCNPTLNNME